MVKYIVYCVALFRQVLLVADTLKLGGTVLSAIPDMLAAQLVARLVSAVTVGVYTVNVQYTQVNTFLGCQDELSQWLNLSTALTGRYTLTVYSVHKPTHF